MVEFGMNPQQALDAPRVFVAYNQKSIFTLHIQTHTLTYTQCGPICGAINIRLNYVNDLIFHIYLVKILLLLSLPRAVPC